MKIRTTGNDTVIGKNKNENYPLFKKMKMMTNGDSGK